MRVLLTLSETSPGDPGILPLGANLALVDRPIPQPARDEVLIRVTACGVNRADIAFSRGRYTPPLGSSVALGLECAGVVRAVGEDVTRVHVGEPVAALVNGGGCAEMCLAHESTVMPLPITPEVGIGSGPKIPGFSPLSDPESLRVLLPQDRRAFALAAMVVEASAVAWLNLVELGGISPQPAKNRDAGRTVLIHGGTGSVGSIAIQLARALGCDVYATAGSPERADACIRLGANSAVDRHNDVVEFINEHTGGRGVNLVLDVSGAGLLDANIRCLADNGSLLISGLLGGDYGEINLGRMMRHTLRVLSSTLRGQTLAMKAQICESLVNYVWPHLRSGEIAAVAGGVWALDEANTCFNSMRHGERIGAHVLLP